MVYPALPVENQEKNLGTRYKCQQIHSQAAFATLRELTRYIEEGAGWASAGWRLWLG